MHAKRPLARRIDGSAEHAPLIDALRGFAALFVAYYHCRQVTWIGLHAFRHAGVPPLSPGSLAAWLTAPVMWGAAGVPIFFVISGYCIHRGPALRIAADPGYQLDARVFWLRRFVRIYPVLVAALLLTCAADSLSVALSAVHPKIESFGLRAFVVNLLSLQGIVGLPYGSNGALWTLSLEVQLYVAYPLVFALRRRFGLHATLLAIAAVNVASAFVLVPLGLQVFTMYWSAWMLGAWIAEIRAHDGERAGPARRTRALPQRLLAICGLALGIAGCAGYTSIGAYCGFQLWAAGFACCLLAALRRDTPMRSTAARWLAWTGRFSYSLYLVHLPVFVFLSALLYRCALQTPIWPSFGFMLAVLPVAWLLYVAVERPAQRAAARIGRRDAASATPFTPIAPEST